tara:strand:- start:110 stop:325 length:216 start_codon:yes stop_codon:yes gene_type:complete
MATPKAEVLHTYSRGNVELITPKSIIARYRDDFAQPTLVGYVVIVNGKPSIIDEFEHEEFMQLALQAKYSK